VPLETTAELKDLFLWSTRQKGIHEMQEYVAAQIDRIMLGIPIPDG
jgi:hypothetical protein